MDVHANVLGSELGLLREGGGKRGLSMRMVEETFILLVHNHDTEALRFHELCCSPHSCICNILQALCLGLQSTQEMKKMQGIEPARTP